MNSKNKNLPIIIIILSVCIFIVLVVLLVKPKIDDYSESGATKVEQERLYKTSKKEFESIEKKQKEETIKVKNLKQIYETSISTQEDNLGVFGDMFEQIISKVQANNLLIRTVEYNMSPELDPIYQYDPDSYNVCELKFSIVCKYKDLLAFLTDINNNFEYLVFISRLNVIDFEDRPDYLLANVSITLYSQKKGK